MCTSTCDACCPAGMHACRSALLSSTASLTHLHACAACVRAVRCVRAQIVLLGVCTGPSKGGGGDEFEELSLQPMPLYSLPSDNVIMTCCASSASGRIFLGGSDGGVFEVQYAASDSWRSRRCSKVTRGRGPGCQLWLSAARRALGAHCRAGCECAGAPRCADAASLTVLLRMLVPACLQVRLTRGLQQLLPSFVPSLLFGPPVPLDKLVVDDERHILYSLAANSALQVRATRVRVCVRTCVNVCRQQGQQAHSCRLSLSLSSPVSAPASLSACVRGCIPPSPPCSRQRVASARAPAPPCARACTGL